MPSLLSLPHELAQDTNTTAAAALAPTPDLIVGGWFGNWDPTDTVVQRAGQGSGVLTDASVFAWNFAGSGDPVCTLTPQTGCVGAAAAHSYRSPELTRELAAIRKAGMKVWGSHIDLDSWNAGKLAAILRNPHDRSTLVRKLTRVTVASGVDGLDLDWENFAFNDGAGSWRRTKPAFVKTIQKLSRSLHAQGKLLSVTVPGGEPYRSNGKINPGSGYWVYAWHDIADWIDRLNLMTYDYSWNQPGPIGPHSWARKVVRSAKAQLGSANAHKIVVGVALYGKTWPTRSSSGGAVTTGPCPASWRISSWPGYYSLTSAQAFDMADRTGAKLRFDTGAGEYTFHYSDSRSGTFQQKRTKIVRTKVGKHKVRKRVVHYTVARQRNCDVDHTVWFSAGKSLNQRARMALNEGIGGVAMWELSSTNPALNKQFVDEFGRAPIAKRVSTPGALR